MKPRIRLFDWSPMKSCFRLVVPVIVALAVSLLAGCGTPPAVAGLGAELAGVKSASDANGFVATIRYINGGTRPVAVQSARHELVIGGRPAGEVVLTAPLGLPPLSSTDREIAIAGSGNAITRALLAEAARTPGATWILSSEIIVDNGGDRIVLKSRAGGKLAGE